MVNNTTVCENTTESSVSLQRSAMVRLRSADEPRINRALDAARSAGANAYVVGYGLKDASGALAEARKKLWLTPGEMQLHWQRMLGKTGEGHGYLHLSQPGDRLFLWQRLDQERDGGCQRQGHGDL